MDFDIPTDLINKAQIGFRQAAGLSSFDRKDTTLPSISSVESSISSLDPSPSYLRCKFCQGKLLRGLQSLICIYCGEYQKKDLHPDPISFSSTHGYSWLLQSLNFNGSERIGSFAEGSGINGGLSPAEDELTLSELLDLKLTWRDVPKKHENNVNVKTFEHNSSLNLGTTDFDRFFTKSMSKSAIVSDVLKEQSVASKADQSKIVEGQENFTSDWNAEFQFADMKMENEKPESVDLFEGAETYLSAHRDVGFGRTESLDFKKSNDDSDLFQDDLFASMSSATFQQNEQLDSAIQSKDGLSGDLNDFNLTNVLEEQAVASKADESKIVEGQENLTSDWSTEFQFADIKMENEKPKSVDLFEGAEADLSAHKDVGFVQTESFDFKKPNDDSDLFQDDLFASMSSATLQQNEQLDSAVQAKDGFSGDLNNFNSKNMDGDWFSDGNWQKSSVKNTLNDGFLQDNANDSSADWFENTNWQKNSANNIAASKDDNTLNDGSLQDNPNNSSTDWFEKTNWQKSSANNTDTIKDDSLFDIKPHANDLIPSEKSDLDNSDKHLSDATDWFQNSQWAIGSSTTNIVVNKHDDHDDDDDGFGEWNDFTSSTGNQYSIQDSWKESGNEKVDFGTSENISELNLFQSTVDSQEVDFGNFLQSDISSGAKNQNDTPAMYDIFSEASTAIRNTNTEAGNNVEGAKNDEITPTATISRKDDVQMLISQMHDLSFMLKNELSVPSKPDDIGSTSHS